MIYIGFIFYLIRGPNVVTFDGMGTGNGSVEREWTGTNGIGLKRGIGPNQWNTNGLGIGLIGQVLEMEFKLIILFLAVVRAENLAKQADVIAG
jgi:hypothetical protein